MRPTAILANLPFVAARLVNDVTKSEFGSLFGQNQLALVAFSSRTYEAVQPFLTTLEEVAKVVHIPTYMVNCDEEKELCKEYDVNAYPTLRLFKKVDTNENGQLVVTRYRGKRTPKAIKSFVTKHELPTVTHVDPATLQSFVKIDDAVVIAYLQPDQESLLATFQEAAVKHSNEAVFGYVDETVAADSEGLIMPSIVYYKNSDGDDQVLKGDFALADLESFLEAAKRMVIGDFSERNVGDYMAVGVLNRHARTE